MDGLLFFVSVLALWIVSLCLHEYAHARVAFAGGDTSVADKGYLSLNPFHYLNPVTSILIPLLILAIGGIPLPGGAVWIDTSRLRSRHWDAAVSAAGPLTNLLCAVACALPFTFGLVDGESQGMIPYLLAVTCSLQVLAAILNALPIPPLDGFGVIRPYLPYDLQQKSNQFGMIGLFLLIAIMWNPNPVSEFIYGSMIRFPLAMGIPREVVLDAFQRFMEIVPRLG